MARLIRVSHLILRTHGINMPWVFYWENSMILFKDYFKDLIPGLIMEFGVFRGRSLNTIAKLLPFETIYGFDSFEGLPEDWIFAKKGDLKANPDELKWLPNIKLIKGWFKDTLPPFLEEHKETVSIVHIDCDLYSSTKTVLDNLKDRFQDGSIIVFDEFWGFDISSNRENRAFMEFLEENKYLCEYLGKHHAEGLGFRLWKLQKK